LLPSASAISFRSAPIEGEAGKYYGKRSGAIAK
jgi:hypothetical protein